MKKMMYVSIFVLLLGLIGSVQAAPGDWVSVSSKTGDWMTVAWDGGHAYPGTTPEETALLIDSNITVSSALPNPLSNCKVAWVLTSTLNVAAGADFVVDFTVSLGGGSAGATGTMNVYGTTSNGLLQVGNETAGCPGVLNIYGGGKMTTGIYGTCNIGQASGATGIVNLLGGDMDVISPLTILATGQVNIDEGSTLRVLGDQVTELGDYITLGQITGTLSGPVLGTGDDAGWTVVTGIPEPATMILLGLGSLLLRKRNA